MNVPAKLRERRDDLVREAEECRNLLLALLRDQRVVEARLAEIDFAIAAIGDESLKFEAGEGNSAAAATSGAPGAESAPAGIYGGQSAFEKIKDGLDDALAGRVIVHHPADASAPKKPRAPKRDLQGQVLDAVKRWAPQSPYDLAANLGIPLRVVEKAVERWMAKGELMFDAHRNVVLLTKQPEPVDDDGEATIPPDVEAELVAALDEAEAQQSEAAE